MSSALRAVIIVVALGALGFSGFKLYQIMNDYRLADETYSNVREAYTSPVSPAAPGASSVAATGDPDLEAKYEDAQAPMALNWADLQAVNKDIVGWIYMDGEPDISYPICYRKEDDDYYLHRSHTGEYLYAGAIFLEGLNNSDFSDPLSILYGHNMKNGSMFAKLKNYLDPSKTAETPYFWIFTPNGDYRYKIISVMQTDPSSTAYTLFAESGGEFLEYEQKMVAASAVPVGAQLYDDDKCVLLSTCVSDHVHRTVVLGRCVSSSQPEKQTTDPVARTTEGRNVEIPMEQVSLPQEAESAGEGSFGVEGLS